MDAGVAPHRGGSLQGGATESLADGIDHRVEALGLVALEREDELHGAVVGEVADRQPQQADAAVFDERPRRVEERRRRCVSLVQTAR